MGLSVSISISNGRGAVYSAPRGDGYESNALCVRWRCQIFGLRSLEVEIWIEIGAKKVRQEMR